MSYLFVLQKLMNLNYFLSYNYGIDGNIDDNLNNLYFQDVFSGIGYMPIVFGNLRFYTLLTSVDYNDSIFICSYYSSVNYGNYIFSNTSKSSSSLHNNYISSNYVFYTVSIYSTIFYFGDDTFYFSTTSAFSVSSELLYSLYDSE